MKDVVYPVIGACLFDGGDVGGLFEDTDEVMVAGGTGAVDAWVDVGDVVADGAEAEVLLDLADGDGERLRVFSMVPMLVGSSTTQTICWSRTALVQ